METIKARFQPHRTDDLRPDAAGHIGKVYVWTRLWIMDDEDPFPGEGAYAARRVWFGWVPERDLERVP